MRPVSSGFDLIISSGFDLIFFWQIGSDMRPVSSGFVEVLLDEVHQSSRSLQSLAEQASFFLFFYLTSNSNIRSSFLQFFICFAHAM